MNDKQTTNQSGNNLNLDEMSPIPSSYGLPPGSSPQPATPTEEYKVGHHKPPLFLIILYVLVIVWCSISWIPFYGY